MKEKIKKLKSSIESVDENTTEVEDALDRLDDSLGEKATEFPGETKLSETIEETVKHLEADVPLEGILSKQWAKLAEGLEEWEKDHPKITLIIGDIARALGVAGL